MNKVNEAINYPDDESYTEIDIPTLREVRKMYLADPKNRTDKYGELMKANLQKMNMQISGNFVNPLEFYCNSHFIKVEFEFKTDSWVIIHVIYRGSHRFFLCDGEDGVVKFINEFDPRKYIKALNEAINYPDDASFSMLDSETSYVEFLHQYDQLLNREITIKCLDMLHTYFFNNDLPVSKDKDSIYVNTEEFRNAVSVTGYTDEWVLVNSYQGAYLCDQIEGFQALLDSGILLQDPEEKKINENIELDIDEDSYDEASSEDVIAMWRRYKPRDFESYELNELRESLGNNFQVNEIPNKEFTITVYSKSEKMLFILNQMNDGWIIAKSEDTYYICDQITGLVKFLKGGE